MLLPIFVIKHRIIKFHFDQMFEVQEINQEGLLTLAEKLARNNFFLPYLTMC